MTDLDGFEILARPNILIYNTQSLILKFFIITFTEIYLILDCNNLVFESVKKKQKNIGKYLFGSILLYRQKFIDYKNKYIYAISEESNCMGNFSLFLSLKIN